MPPYIIFFLVIALPPPIIFFLSIALPPIIIFLGLTVPPFFFRFLTVPVVFKLPPDAYFNKMAVLHIDELHCHEYFLG